LLCLKYIMYHFLVSGNDNNWEGSAGEIPADRCVKASEYTEPDLARSYGSLSGDSLNEMLRFPALFAYENNMSNLKVGKIISIQHQGYRNVRISYEMNNSFPEITPDEFARLRVDLDIHEYEKNRTHWAIKRVDLFSILEREGHPRIAPTLVNTPNLQINDFIFVQQALDEADTLLRGSNAVGAVDRAHTALDGYLRSICFKAGLLGNIKTCDLITAFKIIREQHPKFSVACAQNKEIKGISNSIAAIVDKVSTIRNNATLAHPNPNLLDTPEAMLSINVCRTIMHYVHSKVEA
jgi:hypothetical protein